MNLLGFGKESLPSVIKDPFSKKQITSVSVTCRRSLFHPYDFSAYGSVEFKNGDTTGCQNFNGETFDEVVLKIKQMMESL